MVYFIFEVIMNPPMNLASYRKAELDAKLINTYMPLNDLPYMSKQTILKKMGFSQADIVENEQLWLQENPQDGSNQPTSEDDAAGLQSVGIDAPNDPGMDLGLDDEGNLESADAEYQEQQGSASFDPNNLGDSF